MEATAKSLTILILEPDDYAPDALAAYRALGRVLLWPEMNAGQRNRALAGADILVVRLVYRITNPWLSRMPNLKIIATPTTGLTHIDTDAAKKRGIKIGYVKQFVENIGIKVFYCFEVFIAFG